MNKEIYKQVTSRLPLKQYNTLSVKKIMFEYPKSTDKRDIIDWIIKTKFVDNYTIQLAGNDDTAIDDEIQDIYLMLLEKPQEEWDKLTCQGFAVVRAYIAGVIYRQIKSSNSYTQKQYRRYNQNRMSFSDLTPQEEKTYVENEERP